MHRQAVFFFTALAACAVPAAGQEVPQRRWLAGDHHVHSIYSARYTPDPARPDQPPPPIVGGDSSHTIEMNAQMARRHGLNWMVSTDHGGPNHAELNHARAWPDVVAARRAVPGLVLFYGMEFDVPGGEHASLILPIGAAERDALRGIERGYGKRELFPADPARNTKPRMIEALRYMAGLADPPVVIGNHPSRTAKGLGIWGQHAPEEYRAWHAAAPRVTIGMEGAPGHQAARPKPGLDTAHGSRGLYGGYPTMGGFDQMVATLGGGWDALLGQGLHWTITATSDSHGHWREGGADFWPGEYAKTWVFAAPTSPDILDGLRAGRVFVATGGLIEQLDVTAAASGRKAAMGDTLAVKQGDEMIVTIRFRPAGSANAAGAVPRVDHVDLIAGDVTLGVGDRNPSAKMVRRFTARDWRRDGKDLVVEHRMPASAAGGYLRVRGTSTPEGEPVPDVAGEDPWQDLWFYSNPVYWNG
ncbi:phosphoesterase [Sphingomonas sp. S1-29]|uniref:phosphoesterase n=1 Tax=Sphingomonas sp. S1-29 TaxID=2991074 RepID=UPI00223FC1B2|nr:phosphoesterase [Sphingomonas sp. S1-29]UZK69063.1 phosphoesterase [Sphingomonas sp. S1-29]